MTLTSGARRSLLGSASGFIVTSRQEKGRRLRPSCSRGRSPAPEPVSPFPSHRTGGSRTSKGAEVAARLITERDGSSLSGPEFEILRGKDAVSSEPEKGTIARGAGLSPWDGLVIDGDYIKAEAQAGRMGSILYAVAIRLPETQANGKTKWVRSFRSPTKMDLDALGAAEDQLEAVLRGVARYRGSALRGPIRRIL